MGWRGLLKTEGVGKVYLFDGIFKISKIKCDSWAFDLYGGGELSVLRKWARLVCSKPFLIFLKSIVRVGFLICVGGVSEPRGWARLIY